MATVKRASAAPGGLRPRSSASRRPGAVTGGTSPGQWFAPTFRRHMYEFGTRPEQVASVRVAHSKHASNNPKALHRKRVTVADVLASRMIGTPAHSPASRGGTG